jgi:hypothetical protein
MRAVPDDRILIGECAAPSRAAGVFWLMLYYIAVRSDQCKTEWQRGWEWFLTTGSWLVSAQRPHVERASCDWCCITLQSDQISVRLNGSEDGSGSWRPDPDWWVCSALSWSGRLLIDVVLHCSQIRSV